MRQMAQVGALIELSARGAGRAHLATSCHSRAHTARMALNWGDVPSWVAAVGTVSAVSVALWQSGSVSRKERVAHRREQAQQVSGWYGGDMAASLIWSFGMGRSARSTRLSSCSP